MSNLFISHSSRDNAAAKELQARLEEQGHRSVFLDLDPETGIQAGVSWERTLYTKLRACRAVVALCSDSYLASQWCFAEIALARMEGKELFVLQIDPWSEQTQMPSILTEEQYIDLRTNRDDGYQRLWNGFKVKGIVVEEHRQWTPGKSPYPGLRAFEEKDAAIFFGRDDEVREGVELLNRVRRQGHPRLVMVLGSSGSGKSSLARAGIVPQLRRDAERWLVVGPFRPGRQPALELALALSKAFNAAGKPRPWEEILGRLDLAALESAGTAAEPPANEEAGGEQLSAREVLREALLRMEGELTADDSQVVESVQRLKEYLESSPATTRSVRAARAGDPGSNPLAALATELRLDNELPEAKVVLVIDQFEELLGHENDGEDHPANRFLSLLKGGIEAEDNPPLALGTMRSDFLGMLQRSGPLRGVGFKSLSVGPMSEEGMLKVIEEPATLGQIDLEKPELTHRLLRETGTSDALPLLAFTLRAMWDRYHETRRFDAQGYEALGGLQGAIAQVADDTMEAALAKSEAGTEKDLRVAFLGLARPAAEGSGWARQPASWDEMPERVQPMIQHFIDQRLLVKRADGTVEVAHEALFRSWETLRGWLNANAEGLYLLREIRIDAEKWEKAKTEDDKKEYFWRGGRLARALELRAGGVLALKDLDRAFLEASDRTEKSQAEAEAARRRRELRLWQIGAVVVGTLLVAALYSWWSAFKAREAAEVATVKAQDQTRIAVATEWLKRDPTRAALVLLELANPEETAGHLQLMSDAMSDPLAGGIALQELIGHEDLVMSAAFSPQGSAGGDRIVTASQDRTVRVWSAGGGDELVPLPHPEPVYSAAFDPAGERIVTASEDKLGRVWRADGSGTPLLLRGHKDFVNTAFFDAAGDRIVTASNDGTARIWNAADGKEQRVLDHRILRSADGLEVNFADFDPDGRRIVTACNDGTVWLWPAEGGGSPVALAGHEAGRYVLTAAFSPKGSAGGERIVTASGDKTVRVWQSDGRPATRTDTDAEGKKRQVEIVLRHDEMVRSAVFSRDGGRIYTAAADGVFREWQADGSGQPIVLGRSASSPLRIDLSPAGDRLATPLQDGSTRVWSTSPEKEPRVLPLHPLLMGAAFGPDGDRVLTYSDDGKIRWWNEEEPGEIRSLKGHTEFLWSLALSPKGEQIVTASQDGTARLWNAVSGEPVRGADGTEVVLRHDKAVKSAAFGPDGRRIVTASEDGTARVWSAASGEPERRPDGREIVLSHEGEVVLAAFSPEGDRIVTASDSTARLWSAEGVFLRELHHPDPVLAAVFSPRNNPAKGRIATTSKDFLWIWEADGSGQSITRTGHTNEVVTAAFSPAGRRIVTGSKDKTARIWNADGSGEPLILRHPDWVLSVAFDPTGKRVLTAALDYKARIWAVSYELLGARIRVTGSVCLDPGFREKSLGEDEGTARERYDRCRLCERSFRALNSTVEPERAFQTYHDCVSPAFP